MSYNGDQIVEDRLAWIDLPPKELIENRRYHLAELEIDLAAATHPIDIENIQMQIGQCQAVIVFEEKMLELFPDR